MNAAHGRIAKGLQNACNGRAAARIGEIFPGNFARAHAKMSEKAFQQCYLEIYVNGVLEGNAYAGFPLNCGTRPLFIGTTGELWDNKLEGTVDEVVSAHVHTALTPPNLVAPDITQLTSNALLRAMAKHPSQRFESYDDFRMALEAARSHLLRGQVQQTGQSDPSKSWWRR